MAPPPPKRLLNTDDIKDAPEWLPEIVTPLNAFIKATAAALDRGTTFAQQFSGQVVQVPITPPEDWVRITGGFGGGWGEYDATNFPLAYRKNEVGEVEWQGLISGGTFGFGAPAIPFTGDRAALIPTTKQNFATASNYAFGCVEAQAGGTPGLYAVTGSSAWVSLSGVRYMAADRTPPRWAAPIDVKLGTKDQPFPGRPGQVVLLSCRQRNNPTAQAVVTALDWTATTLEKTEPGLRIHRVWGLSPGVPYVLTLAVFPE